VKRFIAKTFPLVLILILSGQCLAFSQQLQFYKEDLSFQIKDNYFYVDGFYYFCNNSDNVINQLLFYPFPQNSLYGETDSISALSAEGKNIVISKKKEGLTFRINLSPYGTEKLRIKYRQYLKQNQAEYILLTTRNWNKAFETATYKLICDKNLKLKSLSYVPDKTELSGNYMIYYWSKKNFMPDKDMIFEYAKEDKSE
jgi:hypothetical protein